MSQFSKRNYINDALKYSSNRRKIFIEAFTSTREKLGLSGFDQHIVHSIVEYLHSSASIIDDMQDNEVSRKNIPAYYKRNGEGVAAFASIRLWHESLRLIVQNYDVFEFLRNFENLLTAQEADTGLIEIPDDITPIEWYVDVSSRKIAEELLILFKLCNSDYKESEKLKVLFQVVDSIGKSIQYIDDQKDVIHRDILANQEEPFVFTLSFPFALLIHQEPSYRNYVGKKLDFGIAKHINGLMKSENIKNRVITIIDDTLRTTKVLIENLDELIREDWLVLLSSLQDEYWREGDLAYANATAG